MQEQGREHIRLIDQLLMEDFPLDMRYSRLRRILEVATSNFIASECEENNIELDLGRLFDRLNFILVKYDMYPRRGEIHEARISCNKVIHNEKEPELSELRKDAAEIKFFIAYFFALEPQAPDSEATFEKQLPIILDDGYTLGPWKCVVTSIDVINWTFTGLVDDDEQNARELLFKLEEFNDGFNGTQSNLIFKDTLKLLREGDELNLLRIFSREGYYFAGHIIYFPDYLVNVTAIASSILDLQRDIDNWHVTYLFKLLKADLPNVYFLRGNLVNDILDELILDSSNFNYKEWLERSFKKYPIEYTVFTKNDEIDRVKLFDSLKTHKKGVVSGLTALLNDPQDKMDLQSSEIEPFFMQPVYGLQGRLDLMQFDKSHSDPKLHIVELKTSKVFGDKKVNPDNASQLALYDLLTRNVSSKYGKALQLKGMRAILYSSSLENPVRIHRALYKESQFLMNARNVFIEQERQLANHIESKDIVPTLIEYLRLPIKSLGRFDAPDYLTWRATLLNSSEIFKLYFGEYLKFALREKWYAKMGNPRSNRPMGGYRNTWIQPLKDKIEDCSIIANLTTKKLIKDKQNHLCGLSLKRSQEDKGNDSFKVGDIVYLIEQGDSRFNLDNSLIQATIEELRLGEVELEISQRQLGMETRLMSPDQKWMIEHRLFESSYQLMINNLATLSNTKKSIQDIILGIEQPRISGLPDIIEPGLTQQQLSAVNGALKAKDYFLIHGVPGSGKTSRVIKTIVKHEAKRPGNIVLLAYTNKAADKLTEVLVELNEEGENIPFFRMGREKAIADELSETLLDSKTSKLNSRSEVQELIDSTKVVISTIAGLKPNDIILLAKEFRCAIIDEASQILEPTIIGILTKVNKFILVGDHKQLPAITLHTVEQGNLSEDHLLRRELGIKSLRNSYFERIYDRSQKLGWGVTAELTGQGRMHEDIMRFPSHVFYGDKLHLLSEKVQTSSLDLIEPDNPTILDSVLSQQHILFINSARNEISTEKTNKYESKIVGEVIESLIKMSDHDFLPHKRIGVITPFRNQRGAIRQELLEREIPFAQDILVDTVESFQGSEKDHIIISFSVNDPSQMKLITEWNQDRTVDRKLNVALTRAKKQLIMIGNGSVLSHEKVYGNLVEYCRSNDQYLNPELRPAEIENGTSTLSIEFLNTYEDLVIKPIKEDNRTIWANIILGKDHYFNRTQLIEGGRADFTEELIDGAGDVWSPNDRVLAYCYLNMRLHYHSSKYIFEKYLSQMTVDHFIDIGCGPGTSSIALSEIFTELPKFHLLDISEAMLNKAQEFLSSKNITSKAYQYLSDVNTENIEGTVVLNFSFLFANVDDEFRKKLEGLTESIISNADRVLIINQNSANMDLNIVWEDFKKWLKEKGFSSWGSSLNLNISYSNKPDIEPNKQTSLSYEVLSN